LLDHWHEFYLLLGTAAAALIALLFVAVSIGVGIVSGGRSSNTRVYMSPVVVHFTAVLVASAVALVPSHTRVSLGVIIAAGSLGAGIYSVMIVNRVFKNPSIDFADRLSYGVTPLIAYAGGVVAAFLFFVGSSRAAFVLAAAVVLLLVINIRNAWDLMLFFAEQHRSSRNDSPTS
jgi:hypothetical protein